MKYIFILFFIFTTIHASDDNRSALESMDSFIRSNKENFLVFYIYLIQNDRVLKHETHIYEKMREIIASNSNSDQAQKELEKEDARFLRVMNLRLESYKEYKRIKKHCGIKGYIYHK